MKFVEDILVLFTNQWPIDLRYHGSDEHPPMFKRAERLLQVANSGGAFDGLAESLKGFWEKNRSAIDRPSDVRMQDVQALRFEAGRVFDLYAKALRQIIQVARTSLPEALPSEESMHRPMVFE